MDSDYAFPAHRLKPLQDPSNTPLVLVACGSFSPVTFLHLRMFEMARDHARFHTNFEVVAGYLSLVNDAYMKPGLAPAAHRYEMCRIACEETSDWLMVDPWEARQLQYVPTAPVLDHFDHYLNQLGGGVQVATKNERRPVRIILLAGSDMIQTMSQPGLWAEEDLRHILGRYGCYIIERAESELDTVSLSDSFAHSRSPLAMFQHQIYMVPQLVRNDVSSTKVRLFVRKGMSVRYLVPSGVVKYIQQNELYRDELGGVNLSTPSLQAARSPAMKPMPDPPAGSAHLAPPMLFLDTCWNHRNSDSNGPCGSSTLSNAIPPP